jgi:site-specific DNA-methyltransferase (adenine-specific)
MKNGAERPSRLPIKYNARQQMAGAALLRALPDRCAAAFVFDPQYRSILDKMGYGNEGKNRERKRAGLSAMNEFEIARFVEHAERILKPSGHLFLWVDKFMVGSGRHLGLFAYAPDLAIVDLICWNKLRNGMGRRARCRSEYLVVAQKKPTRAKGVWTDHRIDDCWPEMSDRSIHPHAKPRQLTERLIRAATKRGDLVVDPCAGSYGVLDACHATGRRFVGCDIVGGE